MVKVYYRSDSLIDEKCNYLNIPEKDRKMLVVMLDNLYCDEDIEVNIIKSCTILKEFKKDPRIRKDLNYGSLKEHARRKKISHEELKTPFKDCKICYCTHASNFNDTIVTVFHELNHFNNPFSLSELKREIENCPDKVSMNTILECEVKIALNEYAANKKVVEQLLNYSELKKTLISECNEYFNQIRHKILYAIASSSERNRISKFFEWGFIDFFRYLGYCKGFHENNEIIEFDEGWNDFISSYLFDFIDPKIFKSLKSTISILDCNFEEIFRKFKGYFQKVFNIQF